GEGLGRELSRRIGERRHRGGELPFFQTGPLAQPRPRHREEARGKAMLLETLERAGEAKDRVSGEGSRRMTGRSLGGDPKVLVGLLPHLELDERGLAVRSEPDAAALVQGDRGIDELGTLLEEPAQAAAAALLVAGPG